eukprot:14216620-Alexandrium_andersonii.AAC.1
MICWSIPRYRPRMAGLYFARRRRQSSKPLPCSTCSAMARGTVPLPSIDTMTWKAWRAMFCSTSLRL